MSTSSSLKARSAPLVQVRDVDRVASGSPARLLLKSKALKPKGPQAALALIKRHMSLPAAHAAVTLLADEGEAIVDVPMVEDVKALARDLAACNIAAKLLKSEKVGAER
jgi:hypothetical protein